MASLFSRVIGTLSHGAEQVQVEQDGTKLCFITVADAPLGRAMHIANSDPMGGGINHPLGE
jgi:hypothetical protein